MTLHTYINSIYSYIHTYIHTAYYKHVLALIVYTILYIHTYIHTGRAYYILGEFETAMNHYRKGLKFDPEHKGIKDMYRVIKKVQDFQKKAKKSSAAVSVCMYVCM